MKRHIVMLLVSLSVATEVLIAQWTPTHGPFGGEVLCLITFHDTIVAGTRVGAFQSVDHGETWQSADSGLNGLAVYAYASAFDRFLLAGTHRGVFRYDRAEARWIPAGNGIGEQAVMSLAAGDSILFAGTYTGGLFRSSDGGETWIPADSRMIGYHLGAIAAKGHLVFVGTTGSSGAVSTRIFRSCDDGVSWEASDYNFSGMGVLSLAMNSDSARTIRLFAGTEAWGVFISPDSGRTWSQVSDGLPALDPLSGRAAGIDYRLLERSAPYDLYSSINTLVLHGTDLIAGTNNGLYRTSDDGIHWLPVGDSARSLSAFSVTYDSSSIVVGTRTGIFCGDTGGTSWSLSNEGLGALQLTSMASYKNNLFVGTKTGLFRSEDGGQHWKHAENGLSGNYVEAFGANSTSFYVAIDYAQGDLYQLTEDTLYWTLIYPTAGANITIGVNDAYIFVGNFNGVFMHSLNVWDHSIGHDEVGGSNVHGFLTNFSGNNARVIAVTNLGLYSTIDNGTHWTPMISPNVSRIGDVQTLAYCDSSFYAATRSAGVFVMRDGDSVWTTLNLDVEDSSISAMATDGMNLFIASTVGNVYYMNTGERQWHSITEGLPTKTVTSMVIDDSVLFAGVDGGVWKRRISEILTSIGLKPAATPSGFLLEQNFPNPSNPSTVIRYALPYECFVTLKIVDILGREIATLVDREQYRGSYSVTFSGEHLSSGIYFYQLRAGRYAQTKKLVLVK